MPSYSTTIETEVDGEDVTLYCTFDIEPYVQGNYSGPPEYCYEDDGGYASIVSAFYDEARKKKVDLDLLLEEEIQSLEKTAYDEWLERQSDDEPDWEPPSFDREMDYEALV